MNSTVSDISLSETKDLSLASFDFNITISTNTTHFDTIIPSKAGYQLAALAVTIGIAVLR